MTDRDKYSRSPSRSPNVQRATSYSGPRLHYNYTGTATRTKSSRTDQSTPRMQQSNAAAGLQRQSTFDYGLAQPSNVFPTASTSSRHSAYTEYDPKGRSKTESSVPYQSVTTVSSSRLQVPGHDGSSPRISHRTKDVALATSSPSSSSSPQQVSLAAPPSETRGAATNTLVTTRANSTAMSYGARDSSSLLYSSYDSRKSVVPENTSRHGPAPSKTSQIPQPAVIHPSSTSSSSRTNNPYELLQSHRTQQLEAVPPPPPVRTLAQPSSPRPVCSQTQPRVPSPESEVRSRIQTAHLPPVPVRHPTQPLPTSPLPVRAQSLLPQPLRVEAQAAPISTHHPPPPLVRQSSVTTAPAPKPQSLTSHIQMNQRSRTLNIGYSSQQRQEIELAQAKFAETIRKQEAETKARMEAEKAAVEAARVEAARKAQEAARRAEATVAKQAAEAPRRSADDDEDVEKFIQRLEQQIKDSRESKNGEGALAGRQTSTNPAALVESLTNALKNDENDELVEGRDDADGNNVEKEEEKDENYEDEYEDDVFEDCEDDDDDDDDDRKRGKKTAEGVADSSEEYSFLERIRNMQTDMNANRRKFAEKHIEYTDDEDADSELHSSNSINSFLSTVPEEDMDDLSSSLHNSITDSRTELLFPSVISYIHGLVDDILSSLDKTDFKEYLEAHEKNDNEDLYVNDTSFNYYVISENAKQFFTPRTSADSDIIDPTCH